MRILAITILILLSSSLILGRFNHNEEQYTQINASNNKPGTRMKVIVGKEFFLCLIRG